MAKKVPKALLELKKQCEVYASQVSREADVASLFLKKRTSIQFDDSLPACAGINMENYEIFFNSEMISASTAEIIYENEELKQLQIGDVVRLFKEGLILHELGHYLYSVPSKEEMDNFKNYCPEVEVRKDKKMTPPYELATFVSNVIEDSYIQTALLKEYPSKRYKLAMLFLQNFYQNSSKGYSDKLNRLKVLPIQTKLFYFILRAYHPQDDKILNLFGLQKKYGWSSETIKYFDKACTIVNSQERSKYTMEVVVPSVFKDLVEDVGKIPPNQLGGQGSLLDSDKIRVGEPDSSSFRSGQDDQNGSQGQQDQGKDQSGQGDNQSKAGDSQKENQDGQNGQDGKNEEDTKKDGEGKEQNGDEQSSGSSKDSQSSSQDSQESKGSSKSSSKSSGKKNKEGSSQKNEGLTDAQIKSLEKEIKKACEELNKKLDEADKDRKSVDKNENFKSLNEEEIRNLRLEEIGCAQIQPNEYNQKGSHLNNLGQSLYLDCSSYFEKLYNISDYTVHGLDNGDIDPTMMIEWYTEKNTNIYQREFKNKQGREFQMIFICDASGSMKGDRWNVTAQTIASLVHAMDDVGIPSSVYLFADKTKQVKRSEDPCQLNGTESSVLSIMDHYYNKGGTNPSAAFEALTIEPTYQGDATKIVFFLTDGAFDNDKNYYHMNAVINELSARGNWYFISIGINLSDYYQEKLKRYFYPGVFKNYNLNELRLHLGEDIYNTIVDEFIKL